MEQRFILRLAEIDDIPSIMEIEQICFDKDSFSKRQFVYLISQAKGYFCVAEYQQRVGGYFSVLINVGSTQGAIPYSYGWFPHVCPRTIRTCSHVYGSPLVSTLLLCFFDFCKTFFAYSNGFTIHK